MGEPPLDALYAQNTSDSPKPDPRALPPVEAPSASFILQLFLIPMMIVMIIVALWLAVNWLTHMGTDPARLVDELQQRNDGSWQKAFTLANMLRNPEYEYLRDDEQLAQRLSTLLEESVEEGSPQEDRVRLRLFLCRALGEFRTPLVMDALLKAATSYRELPDLSVQRTALEAIAIAAGAMPDAGFADRAQLVDQLIEVSRNSIGSESDEASSRDDVRATSAFALGVIGGSPAKERLAIMLDDSYPNARYNAATGLARQGDPRGASVLSEMLDPDNPQVIAGESRLDDQLRKRLEVINSALRSAARLARTQPLQQLPALRDALQRLSQSHMPQDVKLAARELLLENP